jgi:ubiquinone/menaquinone biosynthesis C-methylase UbiE
MKREEAKKIAEETQNTYDVVARKFSDSRATFWEELLFLVAETKAGDHMLDIGCGNGRLFPLIKERHAAYTGIDYSEGLVGEAKRLHPGGTFLVGDATRLPFPAETFDIAYSFAVIHHIPGKELREQFMHEAARVLKPGGLFILTAWDLRQPKHFLNILMSLNPCSPLEMGDLMLTFGKDKAPRYLHAFTEREISTLLTKNGFAVIENTNIARPSGEKNIVVVARKR